MSRKLSVVLVTQDDPFYVPEFIRVFLEDVRKTDIAIDAILLLRPFGESWGALLRRMHRLYGIADMVRRGGQYASYRLANMLRMRSTSVACIAAEYGIPVQRVENVNSAAVLERLRAMEPDVVLSVAAPQIFRRELLSTPRWGCLNVHSAKLPEYRGMMPNFWALYHGDREAGITVHKMDEKLDRGKVVLQGSVDIRPSDSLDALVRRSKREAAKLVLKALLQIAAGEEEQRDFDGEGSYFSFPTRRHVRELRRRGRRLL